MARKNKIFHNTPQRKSSKTSKAKKSKQLDPKRIHGSAKRAERSGLLERIFSSDDLRDMSLQDIRDFKAYIRKRQKEISELIESDTNLDYKVSAQYAEEENLTKTPLTDNAVHLYEVYMRQENYLDIRREDQIEIDTKSEASDDLVELMNEDDKWIILRRIAAIDPRINLDRAYASQVLEIIEDEIERSKYSKTYQELADELIENWNTEELSNIEWTSGVMSFEDRALIANKGFHGVERAMAKERRRMNSIDNYSPVW